MTAASAWRRAFFGGNTTGPGVAGHGVAGYGVAGYGLARPGMDGLCRARQVGAWLGDTRQGLFTAGWKLIQLPFGWKHQGVDRKDSTGRDRA